MPNPAHQLITFRGNLGSDTTPVEQWSVSTRWASATSPISQQRINDIGALFRTFIITAAHGFSTAVFFKEARGYEVGTDGRATTEPVIYAAPAGSAGTTNSFHHPWQCSLVLSFEATGLGKGKRGRIYLPPMAFGIGATDGVITAAQALAVATGYKTFLDGVKALNTGSGPSQVIVGKTGAEGTMRDITLLRVGRVIDTQRRRRRNLAENYSEVVEVNA